MAVRVEGYVNVWLFCDCEGEQPPHNRHHCESRLNQIVLGDHPDAAEKAFRQHIGDRWGAVEDWLWLEGPTITPVGEDVVMNLIGAPKLFEI